MEHTSQINGLSQTTGAITKTPAERTDASHPPSSAVTAHSGYRKQVLSTQLSALLLLGGGQIYLNMVGRKSLSYFGANSAR